MELIGYDFYTEEYGGTSIPQPDFKKHIRKSMLLIRAHTFERVMQDWIWEAKMAACEIAELFYAGADSIGVASVSNDGYSVSYRDAEELDKKAVAILTEYLGHTDLLYWGCEHA